MSYKLDPHCPPGPEIVRVVRELLAETIAMAGAGDETATHRIHFSRTHGKKIRAALKLARTGDRKFTREENGALRQAARRLSALRDADVMGEALASLLVDHATATERRKVAAIRRKFSAHLQAAQPTPTEVERRLAEFAARLRKVDARLAKWTLHQDVPSLVKDHRRAYKRARVGLAAAQELGTGRAFHEWRKAAKVYAHQCRLLRAAWPPAMKELRDELKELGRLLGAEHDLTVLRQQLKKMRRKDPLVAEDAAFDTLFTVIDARREALRATALPLGERLFADKPRAVAKRLKHWWRVAREEPEPDSDVLALV